MAQIFDFEYLAQTAAELIRIKTVNQPPLKTDYGPMVAYLDRALADLGLETFIEGKDGFPNLVGRLPGKKKERCIMLNAHMDTVPEGNPLQWRFDPFQGVIQDGFLHGRGACDMKGQIAVILTVLKALRENRVALEGEVAVSFVSGHETGSVDGSLHLLKKAPDLMKADLCFIPEPTNFTVTLASRGIYWIKAKTEGISGHTATFNSLTGRGRGIRPINAVHKMSSFIQHVLDVDQWMDYRMNPYTGTENAMYSDKPIIEFNIIRAGEKQNTVPGECSALMDIRFLPGQTPEGIMGDLAKLVKRLQEEDPEFIITFEDDMIQHPPMDVAENSEIVKLAGKSFQEVFGKNLEFGGVCAPGDAVSFSQLMPTVWLGPSMFNAHAADEMVSIEELRDLTRLYFRLVTNYCQPDDSRY